MARNALDGVAVLVLGKALRSEGHSLVELHVVAYDTRGTHHDTRSVVDGEVMAYLGPGMNVDAGFRVSHLCNYTRYKRYAHQMQFVGDAVVGKSLDDGIARDDLAGVHRGGVAVVCSLHVGGQCASYLRQFLYQSCSNVLGPLAAMCAGVRTYLASEAQSRHNLVGKHLEQLLDICTDMEFYGMCIYGRLAEVARKDDGSRQFYDFPEHLARW